MLRIYMREMERETLLDTGYLDTRSRLVHASANAAYILLHGTSMFKFMILLLEGENMVLSLVYSRSLQ
jgi:hypothetical protein